ncbi:MAG: tyrosine-type recombinase/integrase [Lachnospiraceae bacterium]|uniref:tyrosine-type recombinase/integrase n=1 Tax=Galactobacillus timonensis TaxID=2041840 RepID=UPI0023F28C10|nr:tyrosine-type recombinase/integrase [Galactobacillus timonensis]MDD7086850.1 tyrosine-type recombinase/integrase [Galactobacillus timonensis]MDY5222659.1 tyrosine-type recombinase/integrase [Lachnospiraceae bacterium]
MKLDLAYKKYMSWLTVNEGKSPNTIDNYGRDLRGYLAWLQQEEITDTDAISGQLIEQYLQSQKDVKAVRSIAREAAAIRSFHHYLAFVYDAKDPSVNIEVRHSEDDLPVYATRAEMDRLLSSFTNANPKEILDHALLEFIYACGLRVSEAVNLTLNRVNLEEGMVRVLGKGNKERLVPVPKGSVPVLKRYLEIVRPLFVKKPMAQFFVNSCGRPVTVRYVELLVREKCEEAGIDKHLTPHKLRHSYATHLLQGGADLRSIQELLGHADIGTTEIYTHVADKQLVDSYQKFNPVASHPSLDHLEIPEKPESTKKNVK